MSNIDSNISLAICLIKTQGLDIERVLDAWEKLFIAETCDLYNKLHKSDKGEANTSIKVNFLNNLLEIHIDFGEDADSYFNDTSITVYYEDEGEWETDSHKEIRDYDYNFEKMLHGLPMLAFQLGVIESFSE